MYGYIKRELLELAWEKPILAQLEVTNKCNQQCIFCYAGYKQVQEKLDLTLNQWKTIIQKLRSLGIKRLDFTGRESFMYRYFMELIKWCKEQGFEIRINTNGTHDVSKILNYVDEIVFSIHGIDSVHDKIVGYPGSFNLIRSNIGCTVAAGVNASINMSLVKSNYHQLLAIWHPQIFPLYSSYVSVR